MRHGQMLYLLWIAMLSDRASPSTLFYDHMNLDVLCSDGAVRQLGLPWDCTGFVWCFAKRAFAMRCPEKLLYNQILGVCDWPSAGTSVCFRDQTGVLNQICQAYPWLHLPNPTNCAEYYDCTQRSNPQGFTRFLMECPYPSLFSTETLSCRPFLEVECRDRYEPKTPCEYMQYRQLPCPPYSPARHLGYGPAPHHCPTCEYRFPGCHLHGDGPNAIPGHENSRFFMECHDERTLSINSCVNNTIFAADRLRCVPNNAAPFVG
ncbi:hypothetical protein ScPMuIL_018617 [Solemya velum]